MISRTVGFLGLIASVLSLSSIVYGAFQEPLGPYMQGVAGGVLETYRTMREMFFSGFGALLSELINWVGRWIIWVPPAPWFSFPPSVQDYLVIYTLIGSAFSRYLWLVNAVDGLIGKRYLLGEFGWRKSIVLWMVLFSSAALWPRSLLLVIVHQIQGVRYYRLAYKIKLPVKTILRWFIVNLVNVLLGFVVFFLLAYSENQFGL